MDLTAFRTAVYRRLGVPSTDTGYTTTDLDDFINAAVQQFSLEDDWSWLYGTDTGNTVATVATITPAATTRKVRDVVVDSILYRRVPLGEVLDDDSELSASVFRGTWSESGSTITLRPVPASVVAYTLYVTKYDTTMSAGGDTPLAPAQYHNVIADLADAYACPRFNRAEQLDAYLKLYHSGLKRILGDEQRVKGGPNVPRVRRGSPW